MKRRIGIGIVITGILLAAAILATMLNGRKDEANLQGQLRLARAEGLPTDWKEFAARVPSASPAENAAPYYRNLVTFGKKRVGKKSADPIDIGNTVIFHPDSKSLAEAQNLVDRYRNDLAAIDQAVLLPKCWFDRDWSKGAAVLLPEFAAMKNAARVVGIRGSIAASRGDSTAAIADMRRMFVIAKHAGCEPTGISRYSEQSIYLIALRNLLYLSFAHRTVPAYREAFSQALDAMPRPDLKAEHTDELYFVLWLVDHSETPAGRKDLGVKESDVPALAKLVPLFVNQTQARAAIVKAQRGYWAALGGPAKDLDRRISRARTELKVGLSAFPLAASLYDEFEGSDDPVIRRQATWDARRLEYVAALRALQSSTIPRTIETSDLLSPFDGKPVVYRYDGKQIVLFVSGLENDAKPILLKIPPDSASTYAASKSRRPRPDPGSEEKPGQSFDKQSLRRSLNRG